jgi:hypothetical protein
MSATNSGDQTDKEKKLFFTTTDLVNKINTVVDREHKKENNEPGNHPRFELQRRFGDGTTRKASAEEAAAADFQSKMKQVRYEICVDEFLHIVHHLWNSVP